jgi:peptidase E
LLHDIYDRQLLDVGHVIKCKQGTPYIGWSAGANIVAARGIGNHQ